MTIKVSSNGTPSIAGNSNPEHVHSVKGQTRDRFTYTKQTRDAFEHRLENIKGEIRKFLDASRDERRDDRKLPAYYKARNVTALIEALSRIQIKYSQYAQEIEPYLTGLTAIQNLCSNRELSLGDVLNDKSIEAFLISFPPKQTQSDAFPLDVPYHGQPMLKGYGPQALG